VTVVRHRPAVAGYARGVVDPPLATDDWPDAAVLCDGLLAALGRGDPEAAADWAGELVVAIDRALGEQVATLLAHPRMAQLQAAWYGLSAVVAESPSTAATEVQVADLTVLELTDRWLDDALYAGPMDTRGGRPIGLLISGLEFGRDAADLHRVQQFAAVAERALCPFVASADPSLADADVAAPFLTLLRSRAVLRPPLSADQAWTAWFDGTSDAAREPLLGGPAYAVAAVALRAVRATGWPVDATPPSLSDVPPNLPRLLMAARFGQVAAVWCRDRAGPRSADVAADVAELLRGRYVGPRLPLRRADVAAAPSPDGGVAVTLTLSPRLGGDDADDLTVSVAVHVGPR
jgi:hypothetical protein